MGLHGADCESLKPAVGRAVGSLLVMCGAKCSAFLDNIRCAGARGVLGDEAAGWMAKVPN